MTPIIQFAKYVADFISYEPVSGNYNQERALILASEFGAESLDVIVSWASGQVNPHSVIRMVVVKFIYNYLQSSAN